ncbi:hypothetical protein [Nocardiopsis sp. ATB16-24]|uniref:hypothetical protein n=1 Tax=Nocardiopsis sp. ATB16-24 TaxID=3019555 RepID=UPI002553217B|nr:hypothetical protein [Nocardiopsis sp. ATB16-24]
MTDLPNDGSFPGRGPGSHDGPGFDGGPATPSGDPTPRPGHGAPGGTPPGPPPVPGHPERPDGPRRRGTALIVAAVAATLLPATSLGVVMWNTVGDRPYADLPSCRRLMPSDMLVGVPGADRLHVNGEYYDVEEETTPLEDEEVLGYLNCRVEDGDGVRVYVDVGLFEYEDDGEAAEKLRREAEEDLEDRRAENHPEEGGEGLVVLAWRPVSAGDVGHAVLYEGDGHLVEESFGVATFVTANLVVSLSYVVEDPDLRDEEVLGFLDDFAGQVERQLSREAERA